MARRTKKEIWMKVEEIRSHKGWKIAESYLSDGLGHRYDETGNIVK